MLLDILFGRKKEEPNVEQPLPKGELWVKKMPRTENISFNEWAKSIHEDIKQSLPQVNKN